MSSFAFKLSSSREKFGPRAGNITFNNISIDTPNLLTSTSRGVIPHLSRDHYEQVKGWVNVPFEAFLEQPTPTPLLASSPLQDFLGFPRSSTLLSLSARDPTNPADMPPNSAHEVKVLTLRGVRKMSPKDWSEIVKKTKPDVVFALSDTPFTRKDAPFSQKRMTKSLERGRDWLIELLGALKDTKGEGEGWKPAVFLHLPGMATPAARGHFSSQTLLEKLFPPESKTLAPLKTLDEGVDGYSMDLVPIQLALDALKEKQQSPSKNDTGVLPTIPSLLQASLDPLPETKPRLVTGITSPHQLLQLVQSIGVDIVDSHYLVTKLASWGVGLDLEFPVRPRKEGEKRQIGVNLYDERYQMDFTSIGSLTSRGQLEDSTAADERRICLCLACSPVSPPSATVLKHGLEPAIAQEEKTRAKPPFTRAYIHHLLHTHEMSAHTLLTLHNHAALEAFLAGIRETIQASTEGESLFDKEVQKFFDTYDENLQVVEEAKDRWDEVDKARGRGRLKREKEKEKEQEALAGGVDVPLEATKTGEIVEEVKEHEYDGGKVKEGSEGKGERVRGEGAVDL